MNKIFIVLIIGFYILAICGCETVRVGGHGKLGPVSGSGDIVVDVPVQEKEDQ